MAEIPSTPSDGNVATWLVPAIADPSAPTVAELTAAGVVDVSCYLTPDGFALTVDQATITDERLCSTETFGKPGRKTYGLNLTGIDNTNSDDEDDANELVDTLVEGAAQYLVRRRGIAFDTTAAATQKVTVIPFQPGVKQDVPPEANSVIRSTWACFVTGPVHVEVPVVAGA
ncbi:phage tail tube protein [Cellulomonas palmilytica]|uniref:phage tail tube protein n=1 Tax=Cellulomonas palmilytica TaxID=2608402 RepID=UPI001F23B3F9|nr:hypothetical protein [Cellulomonas palmilytica]